MRPLNKKRTYKQLRPNGEPVNSNLPYYNERSGLELLPYLKRLNDDPTKKVSFNSAKLVIKPSTLYHKLNQSWLWLIDHHERKGLWKQMRDSFTLSKENLCVVIRAKTTGLSILDSGVIEDDENLSLGDNNKDINWKKIIVSYVEDSPDGSPPLEITALSLSLSELDNMAAYLSGIDEVVATINLSKNRIKIVKNKALALKLKEERG